MIPKKDNGLRFLTDSRELDKSSERDECPVDRIEDAIDSIGKFNFATSLYLLICYYVLRLSESAWNMWNSLTLGYE